MAASWLASLPASADEPTPEPCIDPEIAGNRAIFPDKNDHDRLEMLRDFDPSPRRTLSRMWTGIKVG